MRFTSGTPVIRTRKLSRTAHRLSSHEQMLGEGRRDRVRLQECEHDVVVVVVVVDDLLR